jgi:flagellar biosynthesis/type III secretory pathway protein FliH
MPPTITKTPGCTPEEATQWDPAADANYDSGYEDGRKAGYKAGYEAGLAAREGGVPEST